MRVLYRRLGERNDTHVRVWIDSDAVRARIEDVNEPTGTVRVARIRRAFGSIVQVQCEGARQYSEIAASEVICETKRDREALEACLPKPEPEYYDVRLQAGDFPG